MIPLHRTKLTVSKAVKVFRLAALKKVPSATFAAAYRGKNHQIARYRIEVIAKGTQRDQEYQLGFVDRSRGKRLWVDGGGGLVGHACHWEGSPAQFDGGRIQLQFAGSIPPKERARLVKEVCDVLRAWGISEEDFESPSPKGVKCWIKVEDPEQVVGRLLAVALAKNSVMQRRLSASENAAQYDEGFARETVVDKKERSQKLVREARKKHGTKCKACGFDFANRYGEHGRGFIEVHHPVPLASGRRKNTVEDVTVLCSNCHRMAHRSRETLSVAQLKRLIAAAEKP
jgi:hypothetical protein